jgi:hypothetical protein
VRLQIPPTQPKQVILLSFSLHHCIIAVMDDNTLGTSIFEAELSFQDYMNEFVLSQPSVAHQSSGVKCELTEYDCVFNSEGRQVVVRSGTSYDLVNAKNIESAISRTTHWDKEGQKALVQTEIQSPFIKDALKAIVPEYQKRNLDYNHISFVAKPNNLFHFRDELFSYGQKLDLGSEAQWHMSLLLQYLQNELAGAIMAYSLLVERSSSPSIDFNNLWTLFKPGDLVYVSPSASLDGVDLVMRYRSIKVSCQCDQSSHRFHHKWSMSGEYLDTRGSLIGFRVTSLQISYFEGTRHLDQLAMLPLRFLPQQEAIKRRMIARGRKFLGLQGCCHRQYKGPARLFWGTRGSKVFEVVTSSPLELHTVGLPVQHTHNHALRRKR